MTAFAEFSDLQALPVIGEKFSEEQAESIGNLLEAASAHLRHIIGQNVYPQETVTYEAYPSFGREDLPQWPVVRVDAVQRDGVDVDFTYRPGFVLVRGDDPVDITFTYGVAEAPEELKRLACVLAAQALQMLETTGALTAGGLSSLGIDDFRAAFADAGEGTGVSLPKRVEVGLRRRFGRGGVDTIEAAW